MGLKEELKGLIHGFDELKTFSKVHSIYLVISFILICVCLGTNNWSSSETAHQGLWRHCTVDNTKTCCGNFDTVIGYKAYMGVTRAFAILELLSELATVVCYILCIAQVIKEGTAGVIGCILALIGVSLMIIPVAVYGSLHDNFTYSASYTLSWSFWIYMTIFLVRMLSGCMCSAMGLED